VTVKTWGFEGVVKRLFTRHAARWGELVVCSLPALVWLLRRANRSLAGTGLMVLLLAGVLSYFGQARGYAYHLAPSFMAFIGFVSISLALLVRHSSAQGAGWLPRLALGALAGVLIIGQAQKWRHSYRALPASLATSNPAVHLKRFKANDGITLADAVSFAGQLKGSTVPDCLLLVGRGSAIHYLAELKQPTRFYHFPMLARTQPPSPLAGRWLPLWDQDLQSTRCTYALVAREIQDQWLDTTAPAARSLRAFLQGYAPSAAIGDKGGLLVYRRLPTPSR
jgi:hypothetical protein